MYNLLAYGAMLADVGRTSAYARALAARVGPGAVVLDIGTGPGIMALLACRAGAAKVYAVEPGDVIEVAREAATASGFADRICFIQAMTMAIDLPERVDGIVSEIHGTLPLFEKSLVSIVDARNRFLKPGGWIVPVRETLWAALASSPTAHKIAVEAWTTGYGFDFSTARAKAANQWRTLRVKPADLLVTPQCWATLDYATASRPHIAGEISWSIARSGIGHGISVWFESETAPGEGFSNSPAAEEHIFGQAFFGWPGATTLSEGDEVRVNLRADFDGDDYVWSWETQVSDVRAGTVKTHYRQSSFLAQPFGRRQLRKRAHTFVPDLDDDGRIDGWILEMMGRKLPLGEIAARLLAEFPSYFRSWDAALTRLGDLSDRYSR
jgi:protein arginine N-methyltransferase 1